jgi:hypothetical protein
MSLTVTITGIANIMLLYWIPSSYTFLFISIGKFGVYQKLFDMLQTFRVLFLYLYLLFVFNPSYVISILTKIKSQPIGRNQGYTVVDGNRCVYKRRSESTDTLISPEFVVNFLIKLKPVSDRSNFTTVSVPICQ